MGFNFGVRDGLAGVGCRTTDYIMGQKKKEKEGWMGDNADNEDNEDYKDNRKHSMPNFKDPAGQCRSKSGIRRTLLDIHGGQSTFMNSDMRTLFEFDACCDPIGFSFASCGSTAAHYRTVWARLSGLVYSEEVLKRENGESLSGRRS